MFTIIFSTYITKVFLYIIHLLVIPSLEKKNYLNKVLYEKFCAIKDFHLTLIESMVFRVILFIIISIVFQLFMIFLVINFTMVYSDWQYDLVQIGFLSIMCDLLGVNFLFACLGVFLRFMSFTLKLKMYVYNYFFLLY